MPLFEWTPRLSVGVDKIDAEHRCIGELLNELNKLQNKPSHHGECVQLIDGLIVQIRSHFSTEERYFTEYEYENADEHRVEHERLLAQLDKSRQEIKCGECAGLKLARYLHVWLTTHILVADKAYVEFFRRMNIR